MGGLGLRGGWSQEGEWKRGLKLNILEIIFIKFSFYDSKNLWIANFIKVRDYFVGIYCIVGVIII